MKKYFLSVLVLAITTIGFISCGDEEEEGTTCTSCAEISSFNVEVCETGDGTLQYEISTGEGLLKIDLANGEIDLPEGYTNIEDYNCQDLLDEIEFDISDIDPSDLL